jgi:SAM-dependent methyltransferase
VRQTHRNLYHPFVPSHGPFDFYICDDCGSGLTLPAPSPERLVQLYASFERGMPGFHRAIMEDDPQNAFYAKCIRGMVRASGGRVAEDSAFQWMDIGAGGGELSAQLQRRFPNARGLAADLHGRPALLEGAGHVDWRIVNINDSDFARTLGAQADVVAATAVWEHVREPDLFARNMLSLVRPGGLLYLMCPDYGSAARRLMGRRWHYFSPGEHLNMPTPAGAKRCLDREGRAFGVVRVEAHAMWIPYTIRYTLRRFGMHALGKLVPASMAVPLPAGVLEAMAWRGA